MAGTKPSSGRVLTQDRSPDSGDWIKIHRSIVETAIWPDAHLVKLWLWCIVKANFRPGRFLEIDIQRGQFVTGRERGAEQMGMSPSTWYRNMRKLADQGYITLKVDRKWTVVTVCNYETYQGRDKAAWTDSGRILGASWAQDGRKLDTIEEEQEQQESKNSSHTHTATESTFHVNADAVQPRQPQPLRLPASADTPRNREQLEAWQLARQSQHGSRTPVVAWEAAAMRHANWSEATWFDALQFSTSKSAKSLLDPTNDFQKRKASAYSRAPEPTYPKLRPIDEC